MKGQISFQPKSLLAFIVAIAIIVIFVGTYLGRTDLTSIAWPIFIIFGGIFIAFLLLTLARNIRKF